MSNNSVDTRVLSSGLVRLRFKLSDRAHKVVSEALRLTQANHPNTALERVCMEYLATPCTEPHNSNAKGSHRLLVKLYAEQYDLVREALDSAKDKNSTDEDALTYMCQIFLNDSPTGVHPHS